MIVYIAHSEPEAYIVVGRLDSEGIPAFVQQEPLGRAYALNVGILGEIKVVVRAADYERAAAILDEDVDDSDDNEAYDEDEDYDEDFEGDDFEDDDYDDEDDE